MMRGAPALLAQMNKTEQNGSFQPGKQTVKFLTLPFGAAAAFSTKAPRHERQKFSGLVPIKRTGKDILFSGCLPGGLGRDEICAAHVELRSNHF